MLFDMGMNLVILPWDTFPCRRPQYTWREDNLDPEIGMNENSEK